MHVIKLYGEFYDYIIIAVAAASMHKSSGCR